MNEIVLKNINLFLEDLNDFCKRNQAEREIVSDDIKSEALEIVENLYPVSFNDAIMYTSALNVLNSYIKKENGNNNLNYSFKKYIGMKLIKGIIENNIDCNIYYTVDVRWNAIYFQFRNIEFSFHRVNLSIEIQEVIRNSSNYKIIEFDGIRKQMVSVSIFNKIKSYINNENVINVHDV